MNIGSDRMVELESGHYATRIDSDCWSVSWLEGQWSQRHATLALLIAEIVALDPPLNSALWREVENALLQLGLDLAVLYELAPDQAHHSSDIDSDDEDCPDCGDEECRCCVHCGVYGCTPCDMCNGECLEVCECCDTCVNECDESRCDTCPDCHSDDINTGDAS